jgi:predicted alpha-1,2-mannosidase
MNFTKVTSILSFTAGIILFSACKKDTVTPTTPIVYTPEQNKSNLQQNGLDAMKAMDDAKNLESVKNATYFTDLLNKSKEEDTKYKTETLPVIYFTLGNISLGEVVKLREENTNIYKLLKTEAENLVKLGRADSSLFERWFKDIDAELTSTKRVGFHRYTFPNTKESNILIDLSVELGPSDTEGGFLKKINNKEIVGYAVMSPTRRRPKPVEVYFVIQFDKPFKSMKGWEKGINRLELDSIQGKKIGAYVSFSTKEKEQRLMKVAISYVSIEQARLNLVTELPHWDFNKVVSDSRIEWNTYLKKIEIKGGTKTEQSRFYTDLWHSLQGRRIVSDVNGKYCDRTGVMKRINQIPLNTKGVPLFNHYNSDSYWGAQWTISTLWDLVYPQIKNEFINSMLLMYKDGGLIPRGPAGGNYTYVMTGATTTPFIISAYMKGIRNFDINLAYEGMRKDHFPGGMMSKAGYEHNTTIGGGIEYYIERGYIPYPISNIKYGSHQDGAGQTLEYAYQDWSLSQLAKKLGKESDYQLFTNRA